MTEQLLTGIRVLENTKLIPGDFLGMLLGDMGADVIKVEDPEKGDYIRDFPIEHLHLNRNKRSIVIDLKTEQGRDLYLRMVRSVDIVIDSFVADAMDRLGVGVSAARKANEGLVYCQITGLGATGPFASIPTHGELMNTIAGAGPPQFVVGEDGNARWWVDSPESASITAGGRAVFVGPLFAVGAVCAALFKREITGKGCYFDISCADAALSAGWRPPTRAMNPEIDDEPFARSGASAKYNFYRAADGRFVCFAPAEAKFWSRFCELIGKAEWVSHDSTDVLDYGREDNLREKLDAVFLERTQSEWMELGVDNGLPISPINLTHEVDQDRHLQARGMFIQAPTPGGRTMTMITSPITGDAHAFEFVRPAPALGQHSDEVLRQFGLSDSEIAGLRDAGVTVARDGAS